MREPELVSCIVPVFNGERYLRETLESILQQPYRPLAIIGIDDGSTDDSAAVVGSYDVSTASPRSLPERERVQ
jgi:glycosyltransferase involved in cell wall biosynthesis